MIRLGIIGFSEGNGHPYSWSAICNGYDSILMETCGFPVIPRYLKREKFPESFLCDRMNVSAIWTQNVELSNKIANSCKIQKIVTHLSQIVDDVDGILLARDDAANHIEVLKTIMPSGLPIYIDKPIALNRRDLETVLAMATNKNQIFTCSAFRFSEKLKIPEEFKADLQDNFSIYAEIPKSWDKYSIHLIEPMLQMIPENLKIVRYQKRQHSHSKTVLRILYEKNVKVELVTTGELTGDIFYRIRKQNIDLILRPDDTFSSFKAALEAFHLSITKKVSMIDIKQTKQIVEIIEAGR